MWRPGNKTGNEYHLVSMLTNSYSTGNLRCSTSIHNTTVLHQISDNTQCIVHTALCFLNNLLQPTVTYNKTQHLSHSQSRIKLFRLLFHSDRIISVLKCTIILLRCQLLNISKLLESLYKLLHINSTFISLTVLLPN